jgi:hypothetical protein
MPVQFREDWANPELNGAGCIVEPLNVRTDAVTRELARLIAICKAAITNVVSWVWARAQPIMRRRYKFITTAKYSQPSRVHTYVTPALALRASAHRPTFQGTRWHETVAPNDWCATGNLEPPYLRIRSALEESRGASDQLSLSRSGITLIASRTQLDDWQARGKLH